MPRGVAAVTALVLWAVPASGLDVAVDGRRLVVVDKVAATGKAKVVFVARDADVSKGPGTALDDVDATLEVTTGGVTGAFQMPAGPGWVANDAKRAKYRNAAAPSGGAVASAVVRPGKGARLAARSLGDTPLDVSAPPDGPVRVIWTLHDGPLTTRLCTRFEDCTHALVARGTGHRLVCKRGAGDPTCAGASTTTTTTSTTSTSATIPADALCCDAFTSVDLGFVRCANTTTSDTGACIDSGGTPVTGGAVCDSTNGCGPAPGIPGPCCQTGGVCGVLDQLVCVFGSVPAGTYFPNAVCSPSGQCVSP